MKLNKLTWSAAALMMLAFSCQRETPVENPNYNPETGEVNTQFVFSVATGGYDQTKQSAANTQATTSQTFRGFDRAYLVTYKFADTDKNPIDGKIVTSPSTAYDKWFALGKIMGAGTIDASGDGTTVPQSRRILTLPIAEGVNTMVFYAQAPKTESSAKQGYVELQGSHADLSAVRGVAGTIMPASGSNEEKWFNESHQIIATVLNHIINTGINGAPEDPVVGTTLHPSYGGTSFTSALTWKDFANATTSPIVSGQALSGLEEILKNTYNKIVTLGEHEVRAGSGAAVARTLGDLKSALGAVAGATVGGIQEQVAKEFAGKIITRIGNYLEGEGSACTWKSTSEIVSKLKSNAPDQVFTAENINSRFASLASLKGTDDEDKGDLNQFPLNFGIPMGAAVLSFDASPENPHEGTPSLYAKYDNFYYNFDNIDVSGMGMTGTVGASNYIYPTELCYFGNSPIRTFNQSVTATDFPDGANNWIDDTQWKTGWNKSSHVVSTTEGVAMQFNVHYANALLQSTVRYGTGTLKDNNQGIHPKENPKTIDVTTGNKFEFTGLIIGGQPNKVGWDFLPASDANFNYMVYDGEVANGVIPPYKGGVEATTLDSAPNYTLLFDSYRSGVGSQATIYVGVELVNHGDDFWGIDNIVRSGGTFYIIGKLDPSKFGTENGPTNNLTADYHLPPYNTDGTSNPVKRVFVQSFKTEAHFVIGENSLQHAYVTVPDLRSTEISVGLSVQLDWVSGVNFPAVVLGE